MKKFFVLICLFAFTIYCKAQLIKGDERTEEYLPLLENKAVGIVCNHTSMVKNKHLVDTLLDYKIKVKRIFTPEHGFKGSEEAGKLINGVKMYRDSIAIVSLYGKNKKPTKKQMEDLDIVLFDLQDVGCRFYTYISTLEYLISAAIENNKEVIVLDRPNPNNYVAGPVLKDECKSFVGMQNIPICYGLTIGEYAKMINEEHLVKKDSVCRLNVIPMQNYDRDSVYTMDVYPSPNLHSMQAIKNYPSLCLFEGTAISVGRGTETPFELIGFDKYPNKIFGFIPIKIKGVSENPPYKNKKCYGKKVQIQSKDIDLQYLIEMYDAYKNKEEFFNPMFDLLAGNKKLKEQIKQNINQEKIKQGWQKDLQDYLKIRNKYLMY